MSAIAFMSAIGPDRSRSARAAARTPPAATTARSPRGRGRPEGPATLVLRSARTPAAATSPPPASRRIAPTTAVTAAGATLCALVRLVEEQVLETHDRGQVLETHDH